MSSIVATPAVAAAVSSPHSVEGLKLIAALLHLARQRAPRTFCPSEVARSLAEDWRPLLPQIRAVATQLIASGHLTCTQRNIPVDPVNACGPIRLALSRPHPPH